ncbi:hypothetical protein MSAN_01139600 [Mycena sanguinolenta]|uniref:Uncharacterized protein n=1 Tax=Mycena sanguinolenta TaxID=230812 RepID=A0A8H6YNG5_9AGAR|nr:hypothetical protein MSAN_01139600 [Mycena sanguinolenta]
MSSIRRLLAALRNLILGNTLVRASTRGLLWLLAALWRATKKPPPGSTFANDLRLVHPQTADHEDENAVYSTLSADTENPVGYISASFMPTSLQLYVMSGPSTSQSSEEVTTYSFTQESYPLHNLLDQHPGTSSVPHLPPLTPAQDLPPSTNSSAVDPPLPDTDSPSQSRRSSAIYADVTIESPPCLSKIHPHISPGVPHSRGRYKCTSISPEGTTLTTVSLPPFAVFAPKISLPEGWTACRHPEGAQYFFHEQKRVFTDANLFDPATLVFINDNVRTVNDYVRAHNVDLPPGVDLVLNEYVRSDRRKRCKYYFVNHLGRRLFWMDIGDSCLKVKGMTSASHIGHELEAQYWRHCECYPRAFEVTHEILDELRDIVLRAAGNVITSELSTVSWKIDDLMAMVTIIDGFSSESASYYLYYEPVVLRAAENVGRDTEQKFLGSNCFVGRLMFNFARHRGSHLHGEPGARLTVHQSVHATVQKRTMFIGLLSPLLFYAPDSHLLGLHAMNIDGLIKHLGWAQFVKGLISEWQESIINAAVVLNADVAFLSIQSVDQGGSARSAAQIASYVSILASIASIIIGLLLSSHHRNRDSDSASAAAAFISNHTHPTLGLETLAGLYSLPYAMLIWSIVFFLTAFSFMCFQNTNLLTRTLVAMVWAVVAALILWCVFNLWETSWDWLRDLGSWLRRFPTKGADTIQELEARSGVTSESKHKKWRWVVSWPTIILKETYDSERSVPNV